MLGASVLITARDLHLVASTCSVAQLQRSSSILEGTMPGFQLANVGYVPWSKNRVMKASSSHAQGR